MITVTDSGAVRTVTINRPERRNAIDDAAVTQLREVVRLTGADANVRALIVTGEGDVAFCAGSDLKATIPSWGGTHRLTRAAGLATAKNMLLGGRIYSAAEAHTAGWVLAVVADGQAQLQAAEVAASMCQESSRDLMATAKELLNAGAIRDPQASSAAELAVEEALASQEGYGQPQGRSAT